MEVDRLTEQPTLSYCWYWGCSRVCHGERYLINRWWLWSSLTLFTFEFIMVILSALVYRKTPRVNKEDEEDKEDEEEGIDEEDPEEEYFIPLRGRRKRQLVQNPSGLMF